MCDIFLKVSHGDGSERNKIVKIEPTVNLW